MTYDADLLDQIRKVVREEVKAETDPINKRLNETATKKDVEEVKDTQQEHGEKLDVAIASINHLNTGIKALDAKVDATKSQLERKINKLPQKAD